MCLMLLLCGCVRRTITITSEPPGALCWLNGREVGRTPVTVDFLYYGTYDVQLTHEGFEPLLTYGQANAPLWDTIPLDFAAELWPGEPHSDIQWHYVLADRQTDRDDLVDRARDLREKLLLEAPIPPGSPDAFGRTTTIPATESPIEPGSQPAHQSASQPTSQPMGEPPASSEPETSPEASGGL